jgi:hypothetical protein
MCNAAQPQRTPQAKQLFQLPLKAGQLGLPWVRLGFVMGFFRLALGLPWVRPEFAFVLSSSAVGLRSLLCLVLVMGFPSAVGFR